MEICSSARYAIETPLPDGSFASISQVEASAAEKSLRIWSTVDGSDEKHLEENTRLMSLTQNIPVVIQPSDRARGAL